MEVAHSGLWAPDQQKMPIPHNLSFNWQSKFSDLIESYIFIIRIALASALRQSKKNQHADRVISFHGRSTGGAKGPRGPWAPPSL